MLLLISGLPLIDPFRDLSLFSTGNIHRWNNFKVFNSLHFICLILETLPQNKKGTLLKNKQKDYFKYKKIEKVTHM